MLELTMAHLDDFTLLRHAAGELAGAELEAAGDHLETCRSCSQRMKEIDGLDAELREIARDGAFDSPGTSLELPETDPFRRRPTAEPRTAPEQLPRAAMESVRDASQQAARVRDRLLAAVRESAELRDALDELSLADLGTRYGILYALQESGRQVASGPVSALRFAELTLDRFRRRTPDEGSTSYAERAVPLLVILGQAHLLAGQSCNWTREFERARTHLAVAYRCFGAGGGDEVGLAIVEHVEAQRRFLLDRGAEALVLARRAKNSFDSYGLKELSAKADVAVGSALAKLGREEEALPLLSSALRVFENRGSWTNYAATLNNLATCLTSLGRLDEARREYARALRALSRDSDRSIVAAIRYGLAEILFEAGRYREAAASFSRTARLYTDLGLTANSLTSSLWEIEAWARGQEPARARHRLEILQARLSEAGALDARVTREIETALAGNNPDLARVSELRERAQQIIRERLSQISA